MTCSWSFWCRQMRSKKMHCCGRQRMKAKMATKEPAARHQVEKWGVWLSERTWPGKSSRPKST